MPTYYFEPTVCGFISSEYPDTSYCFGEQFIRIGWDANHDKFRGVLEFDVSGMSGIVSNSHLFMDTFLYAPSTEPCYARKLTNGSLSSFYTTWNKYNENNNWTTPGGDYTTTGQSLWYLPIASPSVVIPVTSIVASSGSKVRIILMRSTESGNSSTADFYSATDVCNHGNCDPYLAPNIDDPYLTGAHDDPYLPNSGPILRVVTKNPVSY